ncbi:hypothetical protein FNV43_RR11008 [Rhamnella rubrinervis]|uniref:Uncharacterized protein n=1 Tax=Rhamnella rubrinervis TaxID=2594499 RepID=A0A8K0H4S3_9ROSA|nr:hypothetical protein FNV43_RR11008 [Rhamnella rubrinervis]
MLKYDETVRRKILKELEEEDFDPFRCSSFDVRFQGTKNRLTEYPEDMNYKMSYTKVKDEADRVSDDNEDKDPETPSHYHSDEFYRDSSSEE